MAMNETVELNGIEKASVLLMALGTSTSAEVFRHLSEAEIEKLSGEIVEAAEGRLRAGGHRHHGIRSHVHRQSIQRQGFRLGSAENRWSGDEKANALIQRADRPGGVQPLRVSGATWSRSALPACSNRTTPRLSHSYWQICPRRSPHPCFLNWSTKYSAGRAGAICSIGVSSRGVEGH